MQLTKAERTLVKVSSLKVSYTGTLVPHVQSVPLHCAVCGVIKAPASENACHVSRVSSPKLIVVDLVKGKLHLVACCAKLTRTMLL